MRLVDLQAILIVALVFLPLERLIPRRADQRVLRPHWRNDIAHLLLTGIAINVGAIVTSAVIIVAANATVPEAVGTAVRSQPIWLQAIEVIVLADFGFYLAHRTLHAVPWLWRFHSIHHSIEDLDWLAAFRVHPLDQLLVKTTSILPILALGFSAPAIAVFVVTYKWQSVLIHSNVRIDFGPLNWIVASPHFHHWHHANEEAALNKNFGGQLSLIDLVAGTLFMPDRKPLRYGTDEPVPALYHQQMAYPFSRRRPTPSPEQSEKSEGSVYESAA